MFCLLRCCICKYIFITTKYPWFYYLECPHSTNTFFMFLCSICFCVFSPLFGKLILWRQMGQMTSQENYLKLLLAISFVLSMWLSSVVAVFLKAWHLWLIQKRNIIKKLKKARITRTYTFVIRYFSLVFIRYAIEQIPVHSSCLELIGCQSVWVQRPLPPCCGQEANHSPNIAQFFLKETECNSE